MDKTVPFMEADERIQDFVGLCRNSSFPHRESLLKGIESGEYIFDKEFGSEAPSKQLLNIYSARARSLERRIFDKQIKGVHPERLLSDVKYFVKELETLPDEKINFWRFSIDESSSYSAFEGIISRRILGCILTVDKRKVSPSEWEMLWGKD